MAQSFQVAAPDAFVFTNPNEWPKWIRRSERFRMASALDEKADAVKVNALIYAMGDEDDDIMAGFGLSAEEREQYATVKARFDSHFVIRRNTIFERAKFNRRCQEEGELVDSFITALFCLAEFCEYGILNDEMIRDRIVVGIRDSGLSLQLQMDANLTLKKAMDMVRQNEAAKREQSLMRNLSSPKAPVDFMKTRKTFKPKQKVTAKPPVRASSTRKCAFCGRSAHSKAVCPARNASSVGR